MISYEPLRRTMEAKKATTYTLRNKGKTYNVSGSTIERIQANESISTNTLDAICEILDCTIPDIIEYIPNENKENNENKEAE